MIFIAIFQLGKRNVIKITLNDSFTGTECSLTSTKIISYDLIKLEMLFGLKEVCLSDSFLFFTCCIEWCVFKDWIAMFSSGHKTPRRVVPTRRLLIIFLRSCEKSIKKLKLFFHLRNFILSNKKDNKKFKLSKSSLKIYKFYLRNLGICNYKYKDGI